IARAAIRLAGLRAPSSLPSSACSSVPRDARQRHRGEGVTDVTMLPSKLAAVKIIGEFYALMCKRDRTSVSLAGERDATANFNDFSFRANAWGTLFFPTMIHADVVIGLACALRVSFNASCIIFTT